MSSQRWTLSITFSLQNLGMSGLWHPSLLTLLAATWGYNVWLHTQLMTYIPRGPLAWLFEVAVLAFGLWVVRKPQMITALSIVLGLTAVRSGFLGGYLADEAGTGGIGWPMEVAGSIALLSLVLKAIRNQRAELC